MNEAQEKMKTSNRDATADTVQKPRVVMVRGEGSGLAQEVIVGPHRLTADEPEPAGTDTGPTPHNLLAAALGTCTSMTLIQYARRKEWPLETVTVVLKHYKIDAADCEGCTTAEGKIDRIERAIELGGDLSGEQRKRLLEIADKCPVKRTLESEIDIQSRLVD
jgi:putative redox protein